MDKHKSTQVHKRNTTQLKSCIDPHTVIMSDLNIPLSPTDRLSREKLNKEMLELTHFINQIYLTDIDRTFHPNTNEYTFLAPLKLTTYLDKKQVSRDIRKLK